MAPPPVAQRRSRVFVPPILTDINGLAVSVVHLHTLAMVYKRWRETYPVSALRLPFSEYP